MANTTNARPSGTVQRNLTNESFAKYLEGYSQIVPQDLLEAKGGTVRYAIDSLDGRGGVASTQFRLGGTLTSVDPELRYIRLLNPYAMAPGAQHKGVSWSVQLNPPSGQRLRLWYMPAGSKDEVIMFRKLLQQLERGEIKITKVGA